MSEEAHARVVSLADRLKSRREELGLSQAQAARELDVARTAYRLWEMEAAKPQPDRWRLISRWLGVSVTTMLLADELDDRSEAGAVSAAFDRVGSTWGETISDPQTFFARLRGQIQDGTEKGFVNPEHAEELLATVSRIEAERSSDDAGVWEPARLQKRFHPNLEAPGKARAAVDFVARDLAAEKLFAARLLASELVTNSVKHGLEKGAAIGLLIEVDRMRLRVEVRDDAPGSSELGESSGGYGLMFVDRLASRWGSEREGAENFSWFEIDLPAPGLRPDRH
jgi:transcriptional regulator with XRE-family HTH domain/anti-sigma regulatory factor (Ser/Thr protein kinase)